jgi:hypothetical protein
MTVKAQVIASAFNKTANLPYELRLKDFELAMQDVYDFFFDVNVFLLNKGLDRLEDMLRSAILSGVLSDMISASLSKHSRALVQNEYHNGHPDLVVKGRYPGNSIRAGKDGVEVKTTRKRGGQVDTHGARDQWMCVFVYEADHVTEPVVERSALRFSEVYLGKVGLADFRKNPRSELGTKTATLDAKGILKLRNNWVYKLGPKGA